MSVQSEIDRIITAVGNAYSKVSEKGGTVPASQTVANLATAIGSIPAGGGAPSLQSKSVTYTANGTNTITPDEGYDGLSSVDVTVDVSGGGGVETVTLKVEAGGVPIWTYSVFATGIDGVFEITDFGTYDVVKNSMLLVYGGVMVITNLTEVFREATIHAYEVIDNAQLTLG